MVPFGKTPKRGMDDGTNPASITYKARGEGAAAARKVKSTKWTFTEPANYDLQRNHNGKVNGVIDKDPQDNINLEVIIQADSKANANAEVNLPIKHTVVALDDYVANGHTFLNGDWAYHGGGTWEAVEGEDEDYKMTIPLHRYRDEAGALIALTGGGGILVAQA